MSELHAFATMAKREMRKTQNWWWLSCGLVFLTCAGCGSNSRLGYIEHDEELVMVEGRVLFEGKPTSNATIVFHRTDSGDQKNIADRPPNPRGECNENGEFQLYTYAHDDGAPVGDYRVTISWRDPQGTGREDNFPELLPAKYLDPKTSGLSAHITEEGGFIPQFELKR